MATNWTMYDIDRAVFENFAKHQGCADDPIKKARLWSEFERFSKYGPYDVTWERPKPWTAEQTAELERTLQQKRQADQLRRRGHYFGGLSGLERSSYDQQYAIGPAPSRTHTSKGSAHHDNCTLEFACTSEQCTSESDLTLADENQVEEQSSSQAKSMCLPQSVPAVTEIRPTNQPGPTVVTIPDQDQSPPQLESDRSAFPLNGNANAECNSTVTSANEREVVQLHPSQAELSQTKSTAQPEFTAHDARSMRQNESTTVMGRTSPPAWTVNVEHSGPQPEPAAEEQVPSPAHPQLIKRGIRSSSDPLPSSEDEQFTQSDLAPDKSWSPTSIDKSAEDELPARRYGNRPGHYAQPGNSPGNMNIHCMKVHGRLTNGPLENPREGW